MGFFDDPANQPPVSAPGPVSGRVDPTNPNAPITPTPAPGAPSGGKLQGMSDQQKFQAAAQALGIPLNQTRGRQQDIANWLNQNDGPGWQAGANADDWIGTPSGQGIDFSAAGSNAFQWNNDPAGSTGGGAGGAGYGSLWNTLPTADEAMNMPGIQFVLGEANRGLQAGAAAKGTLLNGRVQQGIGESLIGSALSQGYLPLAQLKLGYNQANTGNLYNLANLGLNATSVGSQ